MIYEYECLKCERRMAQIRPIAERNTPMTCPHCGTEAKRIVSRFLFVANLSKDDPANNEARIVTRSASATDQLDYLRRTEKSREETLAAAEKCEDAVDFSFNDIDINGAWTAAHAGPEQLERWRADNVKPDTLPMDSPQ